MLTKAIIESLPGSNSNKFLIRIPVLAKAGITNDPASLMEATLCYNPGLVDNYQVGDVVFVGFEDNKLNKPIILGKLYTNNPTLGIGSLRVKNIEANNEAKLPINTILDNITAEDLQGALRMIQVLLTKSETE